MDSARWSGPYERIPPAPGTNQIAVFVEFRPLKSWKKINEFIFLYKSNVVLPLTRKRNSHLYNDVWYARCLRTSSVKSPFLLFREKGNKVNYKLNSRIIGSLVTPSAIGKNLDVRVTLQHLTVSPTYRWPNESFLITINKFLFVRH